MGEEAPAIAGTPMEGFFDGADVASAAVAAAQKAPAEALVPPSELVSTKESTHFQRFVIGESALIPAKIPTPQKRLTLAGVS